MATAEWESAAVNARPAVTWVEEIGPIPVWVTSTPATEKFDTSRLPGVDVPLEGAFPGPTLDDPPDVKVGSLPLMWMTFRFSPPAASRTPARLAIVLASVASKDA